VRALQHWPGLAVTCGGGQDLAFYLRRARKKYALTVSQYRASHLVKTNSLKKFIDTVAARIVIADRAVYVLSEVVLCAAVLCVILRLLGCVSWLVHAGKVRAMSSFGVINSYLFLINLQHRYVLQRRSPGTRV